MSPLPILYAARLPGGAWLVDVSEALVTAQAGGAEVLRVDVAALLRVAQAVVEEKAAGLALAGAAQQGAAEGEALARFAAAAVETARALAALGGTELLGKEPPQ